jgi:hypothetical protein
MSKPISLKTRLSREYAGIALLTALLLGAILAVALPPFFTQLEITYLQDAGRSLDARLRETRLLEQDDTAALQAELQQFAQVNRASVRLTDASGAVIAEYTLDDTGIQVSDEVVTQPLGPGTGAGFVEAQLSGGPDVGSGILTSIFWAWAIAGSLAVAIAARLYSHRTALGLDACRWRRHAAWRQGRPEVQQDRTQASQRRRITHSQEKERSDVRKDG